MAFLISGAIRLGEKVLGGEVKHVAGSVAKGAEGAAEKNAGKGAQAFKKEDFRGAYAGRGKTMDPEKAAMLSDTTREFSPDTIKNLKFNKKELEEGRRQLTSDLDANRRALGQLDKNAPDYAQKKQELDDAAKALKKRDDVLQAFEKNRTSVGGKVAENAMNNPATWGVNGLMLAPMAFSGHGSSAAAGSAGGPSANGMPAGPSSAPSTYTPGYFPGYDTTTATAAESMMSPAEVAALAPK